MKNKIRLALLCALLTVAAALILTGCTAIPSGSGSGSAAAEKKDSEAEEVSAAEDADEEIDLTDVEAAPAEEGNVDEGREGRPTDSWNQDAETPEDVIPIEDEEDLEDAEDAADEDAADEEDEDFALTDETDDEEGRPAD